jgi:tetratricopeptide (TPR) repeat protein
MTAARSLAVLSILVLVPPAWAQSRADDIKRADQRFEDGRRLAGQGRHAEACRAFEESNRLDPAAGTLINLGDCYLKLGRTTSAWLRYRDAMLRAQAERDEPRRSLAEDRAASVALRVSKLKIVSASADVLIERDGRPVPPAHLGKSVPVDPGGHTVTAVPPGQEPWTLRVDVPAGATLTVEVPVSGRPVARDDQPKREDPRPTFAIVAGAAAVALLGASSIFGLRAIDKWDESEGHCRDGLCDARGVDLAEEASAAATASTVLFITAAAIAGGGAYLWFSSRPEAPRPMVAPVQGGAALTIEGRF